MRGKARHYQEKVKKQYQVIKWKISRVPLYHTLSRLVSFYSNFINLEVSKMKKFLFETIHIILMMEGTLETDNELI